MKVNATLALAALLSLCALVLCLCCTVNTNGCQPYIEGCRLSRLKSCPPRCLPSIHPPSLGIFIVASQPVIVIVIRSSLRTISHSTDNALHLGRSAVSNNIGHFLHISLARLTRSRYICPFGFRVFPSFQLGRVSSLPTTDRLCSLTIYTSHFFSIISTPAGCVFSTTSGSSAVRAWAARRTFSLRSLHGC